MTFNNNVSRKLGLYLSSYIADGSVSKSVSNKGIDFETKQD